ncbi:MAG: hypothetical protein ACREQM_16575 [Candidatus Dormibacteraceae bacterium]
MAPASRISTSQIGGNPPLVLLDDLGDELVVPFRHVVRHVVGLHQRTPPQAATGAEAAQ